VIRLVRFGIGGLIGFLVDSGLLHALMALGPGPYLARVPSFLGAATATWLVNRYWTFADRRSAARAGEWTRYVAAMIAGGLLNYGVYALLLAHSASVRAWPVLGVAAGSVAGMGLNFLSSWFLVFRDGNPAVKPR